jgi:hypothetical protein
VRAIRDSVSKLTGLPIKLYVVENTGPKLTNLDTIEGVQVIYTDNNFKDDFGRKGIKEMFDIYEVAERCEFDDDDIIIKLSGRYILKSAKFVKDVLLHLDTHDCFIKCYNICTQQYDENDAIIAYYGMRYGLLKEINVMTMRSHYSMEMAVMSEIYKVVDSERILKVPQLDMYFQGNHTICV